jgi:hypothetical protein
VTLVVTEKDFTQTVRELARLCGWLEYHTHDSRRSPSGFPDCIFVRRGRMIAAELKSDTGRVSPDQAAWLEALGAVEGVEVDVWRPSMWSAIEEALR